MQNANRFQKGSGCFTCDCCGRNTRSTGRGDNESVGMCAECYDIGGLENGISDGCCEVSEEASIAEIKRLAEIVASKGGNVKSDYV